MTCTRMSCTKIYEMYDICEIYVIMYDMHDMYYVLIEFKQIFWRVQSFPGPLPRQKQIDKSTPRGDCYKFDRVAGPLICVGFLISEVHRQCSSVLDSECAFITGSLPQILPRLREDSCENACPPRADAFLEAMLGSVTQWYKSSTGSTRRNVLYSVRCFKIARTKIQIYKFRSHSCAVMAENSAHCTLHGGVQNSLEFRYLRCEALNIFFDSYCKGIGQKRSESLLTFKNTITWSHFCASV